MDPPENQAGAEVSDVDREETPSPAEVLSAAVLLGAGATAIQHPVIYIKLLIQVGHEPLPPTWGTTLFGRKVLYLPGLFSYAQHILQVDGKCGLFRGLSPHIVCCAVSTVVKRKVKQVLHLCPQICPFYLSHILMMVEQYIMYSAPAVLRCMAQFVGREPLYMCVLYRGLVPHVLGELLYLWGYNLLCHFINTYAEDDTVRFRFSLLYPFTLVADLMALNDCGLAAGLPPYSPVFKSWLHCWSHLRSQGNLFRGSSLFFRRVPASVIAAVEL
uniref:Uncharacterized protein n=1 Tax=Periophthalmus magnuspinnatus TaxID=409849 RepID=A0A3B3ZJB3_9GOBI